VALCTASGGVEERALVDGVQIGDQGPGAAAQRAMQHRLTGQPQPEFRYDADHPTSAHASNTKKGPDTRSSPSSLIESGKSR
jgi:hypothetical protein